MANLILFIIAAVVIVVSAILCVLTKRIMRAATYLLFLLFGVAVIYFLLDYTFLGAAQISVYAGGITMLYIFAIQLVGKQTLQGLVSRFTAPRAITGVLVSLVGLGTVASVLVKNVVIDHIATSETHQELSMETIGTALLGSGKYEYVLPFEFISVFLLACIVGSIMIARKEDKK